MTNQNDNAPEDTPIWASELMEMLGDTASTIDVVHRQAEVHFVIRLLTDQPPDVWAEWAQDERIPMWMRTAVVEYAAAGSKWEQIRQVAELEYVADEVLDELLIEEEEA